MPLFDFRCEKCRSTFETIVGHDDSEPVVCPRCQEPGAARQIVRFRVGGRGDLRESTEFHGCHPAEEAHTCHSSCGHKKASESP